MPENMNFVDATFLDDGLSTIASSIRAKTGGSAQLSFPADFISEINTLSETYPISVAVQNGTSVGFDKIVVGASGRAVIQITPNTAQGYVLPATLTQVVNASFTYDSTSGVVVLTNPTGAVSISAACELKRLDAPIIALNGDILNIEDIENATQYKLFYTAMSLFGTVNAGTPVPPASILDLAGMAWVWHDDVSALISGGIQAFGIDFVSRGVEYNSITFDGNNGIIQYGSTSVYTIANGWSDAAYRCMAITGGSQTTDSSLITAFINYATQASTSVDLAASALYPGHYSTIFVQAAASGWVDSLESNSVSYDKYVQLTTPIAVLSGDRLSVSEVAHSTAFEVYVDGVLSATQFFHASDAPAGSTVGSNFDMTTLGLGAGTYTITTRCINTVDSYYTPSEFVSVGNYVVLPQLDTPTNVSVTGTDATFDEVSNAESYEFFVDGTSIGTYTPASASYTITVSPGYDGTYMLYDGQGAGASFLGEVGAYATTSVTVTSGYLYITGGNPSTDSYNNTGTLSGGVTLVTNDIPTGVLYAISGDGSITGVGWGCFVEGTKILLANHTEKNVEDITYDDELLVWNFYEGKLDSAKPCWIMKKRVATEYKRVLLSDGTELKLVGQGDNCHRLFNVTKQKMLYANECVGDEVATIHGIVTVLSCEKVQETVNYYNIITDTHYNLFAEGVLASCRLSNKYKIEDMKYVGEPLISEEEEQEYFNKLASVTKER